MQAPLNSRTPGANERTSKICGDVARSCWKRPHNPVNDPGGETAMWVLRDALARCQHYKNHYQRRTTQVELSLTSACPQFVMDPSKWSPGSPDERAFWLIMMGLLYMEKLAQSTMFYRFPRLP